MRRWPTNQVRRLQNTGDQDAHRNDWVQSQNKERNEGDTKWNKQNIQGTNSERKETRTQINYLEQKEDINIQPEQNEETGMKKKLEEA